MTESLPNESSSLASDLRFSLVTFLILFPIIWSCVNVAYAPEGKPSLSEYLAIRVFGLSAACGLWQLLKFRRLRCAEFGICENRRSDGP
jgi:hypothetical protein